MNIYLAGKVDEKFGAWRNEILGSRYEPCSAHRDCRRFPQWILLVERVASGEFVEWRPWQPIPNSVLGIHTYTGPFRQVLRQGEDMEHLGVFHGTTTEGMHGMTDPAMRRDIVFQAQRAIERSDVVFAYINSPDAYGTVAEIGYAAALGKFVAVVVDESAWFDWDDFWFVGDLAGWDAVFYDHDRDGGGKSISTFLKDALVAYGIWEQPRMLQSPRESRALVEAAESFGQITRWTSDPRVRSEASRMSNYLKNVCWLRGR